MGHHQSHCPVGEQSAHECLCYNIMNTKKYVSVVPGFPCPMEDTLFLHKIELTIPGIQKARTLSRVPGSSDQGGNSG